MGTSSWKTVQIRRMFTNLSNNCSTFCFIRQIYLRPPANLKLWLNGPTFFSTSSSSKEMQKNKLEKRHPSFAIGKLQTFAKSNLGSLILSWFHSSRLWSKFCLEFRFALRERLKMLKIGNNTQKMNKISWFTWNPRKEETKEIKRTQWAKTIWAVKIRKTTLHSLLLREQIQFWKTYKSR